MSNHSWSAKPTRDDNVIKFCLDFVHPPICAVRQAEFLCIEPHLRQFYISVEFLDDAELMISLLSFSIIEAVCPDGDDFLLSQYVTFFYLFTALIIASFLCIVLLFQCSFC
jgi:hypothetical protein